VNAVPDVSIHFSFVDKVDDVDKDFDAVWSTVDLLSVIEKVEEKCGFGGRIGENQTKIYHLRIQVGSEFWDSELIHHSRKAGVSHEVSFH
jgi:hypothetical protein